MIFRRITFLQHPNILKLSHTFHTVLSYIILFVTVPNSVARAHTSHLAILTFSSGVLSSEFDEGL